MSAAKFLILFFLVTPTSVIADPGTIEGRVDETAEYTDNGLAAERSSAAGTIVQMVIGRNGNEVLVRLSRESNIPCAPLHPNGYRYVMFMDATPGAQEILSALLATKSTGRAIRIVGTGACRGISNDPGSMMEEIQYVIL